MGFKGFILGTALACIGVFGLCYAGTYNNLVTAEEKVNKQESNIDTVLQRRADLIPNLVNTAKGYAAHEDDVYTKLANARTAMNNANSIEDKAEADDELSSALGSFNAIVESYPELKADKQFSELMAELEGSENRITVARKDYNSAVESYNTKIKGFFTQMFFHREPKEYFKANESSKQAPVVDFSK